MNAPPSGRLIAKLVELNDEKQREAHQRLRRDLTQNYNEQAAHLERHDTQIGALQLEHETMKTEKAVERRIGTQRVVLLGSLVGALTSAALTIIVLLVRKALGL